MFELFRIYLSGIPKEMYGNNLYLYLDTFLFEIICLTFSTDKEISDPIYNESHHYTWTWNHFKIADSAEVLANLSQTNLLYSIVRHPFER